MPCHKRYCGENHLHYVTANVYRRARMFRPGQFEPTLTRTLDDLRAELGFRIIGCILCYARGHAQGPPQRVCATRGSRKRSNG